jgi:hypothetical protein
MTCYSLSSLSTHTNCGSVSPQGGIDTNDLHFTKGRKYKDWGAYGQSKLGDLLLAKSVADETRGTKTTGELETPICCYDIYDMIPVYAMSM